MRFVFQDGYIYWYKGNMRKLCRTSSEHCPLQETLQYQHSLAYLSVTQLDWTKTLICNTGRRWYVLFMLHKTEPISSGRSSLQVIVTLNSMAPVMVGNFSSLMVWRQVNCKHPQRRGSTDIRKSKTRNKYKQINKNTSGWERSFLLTYYWLLLLLVECEGSVRPQVRVECSKQVENPTSTRPKGTSKYRAPRIHWRSSGSRSIWKKWCPATHVIWVRKQGHGAPHAIGNAPHKLSCFCIRFWCVL